MNKFPQAKTFAKLCGNRGIVYIHAPSETGAHGFSLSSPFLRIKNYHLIDFDQTWEPNTTDINNAVPSRGYSTMDHKHHSAAVTASRFAALKEAIRNLPLIKAS